MGSTLFNFSGIVQHITQQAFIHFFQRSHNWTIQFPEFVSFNLRSHNWTNYVVQTQLHNKIIILFTIILHIQLNYIGGTIAIRVFIWTNRKYCIWAYFDTHDPSTHSSRQQQPFHPLSPFQCSPHFLPNHWAWLALANRQAQKIELLPTRPGTAILARSGKETQWSSSDHAIDIAHVQAF
jgi:hypothetical protein